MKRLIDADLLLEVINELEDAALFQGAKVCIGDIRNIIATQPIVVCVSDDFPTYKERCEHNEQKRPNQNCI